MRKETLGNLATVLLIAKNLIDKIPT